MLHVELFFKHRRDIFHVGCTTSGQQQILIQGTVASPSPYVNLAAVPGNITGGCSFNTIIEFFRCILSNSLEMLSEFF